MRRPLSLKIKARRKHQPDFVYQSVKVTKLIKYLIREGKEEVARKIVYGAFDEIKTRTKKEPAAVFEEALKNVGPLMEVRTRRVGGANYQIPYEVGPERRLNLALRWLVGFARSKKSKPMADKLAGEIIAASQNQGEAVKKRENLHKMAEANRAFAHFAR